MGWVIAIIAIAALFLGIRLRWAGQERLHGVAYFLFVFLLGAGLAYALARLPNPIPWPIFLGIAFAGIALGYLFGWLWNIRLSKLAITEGMHIAASRLVSDFRISAVLIGLLLSYILTFYFAKLSVNENPPAFWVAFYASWVAGLLFFTVVGLVAGLVTLYRPERDVFAARVKNLLGGITGPLVDYMAEEIRKIGYAGTHTTRIITVEDYNASINAFKVRVEHSTSIKNILRDVAAQARGMLKIAPDKFDQPPQLLGEVTSFRVNGVTPSNLPSSLPIPIDLKPISPRPVAALDSIW